MSSGLDRDDTPMLIRSANRRSGFNSSMIRIAVLSDIHANLPALKAVLREAAARNVTQIAVLADIVGYEASRRKPSRRICPAHPIPPKNGRCW